MGIITMIIRPPGRQRQAALHGRVAEQGLQKQRQRHGAAIQHKAENEHAGGGNGEGAVLQQAKIDHGFFLPQFPHHHADQSDGGDDGGGDDAVRREPIVALAFVQHDFERAQPGGQQPQAHVIDLQAVAQRFAEQIGRIEDQQRSQQQGTNAHRNVDQENPAPGVVVGDPSAERRAHHGREHHAHAVHRHGDALLFTWKRFAQDGLRNGLQRAAAQALQHAAQNQYGKAGRQAAHAAELTVNSITHPM
jgi:hypothetical protein